MTGCLRRQRGAGVARAAARVSQSSTAAAPAGRGAAASRSAARLAGVAVRPRIARAGSPGSAWVAANTRTDTSDQHQQAQQEPAEDESRDAVAAGAAVSGPPVARLTAQANQIVR